MASVTLTQGHRHKILERILNHAFGERKKKIQEKEYKLADQAYKKLYSEELRKKMEALPEGFLSTTQSIQINLGGQWHYLAFRNEERRRAAQDYNLRRLDIPVGDALGAEIYDWLRDEKQLKEEQEAALNNARAVLKSATTLKSLLDKWPEIEEFTKDIRPKVTALAVPMHKLNRVLDLPPEKVK